MNKVKCIYAIKDKRSDKVIYVGQTKNFKQRKYYHFNTVQRPIQQYIFEQGRVNFEMFILEKLNEDITREEMIIKEQFYIDKYNTVEEGLNRYNSKIYDKEEQQKRIRQKYYNSEKYQKRKNTDSFKIAHRLSCKKCVENNKEYYDLRNKQFWESEEYREWYNNYYENNKEKIIEKSKNYYENNKEEISIKRKLQREKKKQEKLNTEQI